jgi:hypothetical protein
LTSRRRTTRNFLCVPAEIESPVHGIFRLEKEKEYPDAARFTALPGIFASGSRKNRLPLERSE